MWFKNLQIYSLAPDSGWRMAPGALEEKLAQHPLRPCTGLTAQSQGWVAPRGDGQLVYAQGRHMLIAFAVEQKLLPAAVVRQEVATRAKDLEAELGDKLDRRQLRALREQITTELLPRAFAKRRVALAWIHPEAGLVLVDTSTPARAEELLDHLRDTLGELPVTTLNTERSAQGAMTQWLAGGDAPGHFSLHEDCELKGSGFQGSSVRYTRHGLEGRDIRDHIRDGKLVSKLGLTWHDRLALILAEPTQVRRLRFLEVDTDHPDTGVENPDDSFDADFTLMTGEVTALVSDLISALGGAKK